jgi:predicted nucleic acid-binding Zn ribbon protein
MKLVKCKSCGEDISPKAKTCPKCGHPQSRVSVIRTLFYIIAILGLILWFAGGGFEQQVNQNLQTVHNKVADDAVQQYQIAKRQGDSIQVCVQAGLVSAAYLQAQDEANYQQWKATETADCRRAGMPR